ncbi:hypothetical protein GCM10010123_09170 [Pilimelia anulata]|uniref:GerMN domain-containing protein n=1 Tax=Pilimelia anulata TaxID=53371 RepID=A0A8J3F7Z0_9ACTN|nr:GerMN domain-containing protein [Pilimelia anulata]GGJ81549.1 hypothetical protein GCM10010123_09170 [Pilimelia anulata]
MSRAAALLAGALAGVLLAGGCGVPPESEPRPIRPPLALPAPAAATPSAGADAALLYLVRDGMLVAVDRRVPPTAAPRALLAGLVAGPTDAESTAGLSSPLAGTDLIGDVRLQNGRATVEVRVRAAVEGNPGDETLAYAQIVCTLTARPDVRGVVFVSAGRPIAVPLADASLSQGPLTRADYAPLLAR